MARPKPGLQQGGPKVQNSKSRAKSGHDSYNKKPREHIKPRGEGESRKRKRKWEEKKSAEETPANSSQLPPSKKAKVDEAQGTPTKPESGLGESITTIATEETKTSKESIEVHPKTTESHAALTTTYAVHTTTIITSSSIRKKVVLVLDTLSVYPHVPPDKPRVMVLEAKGNCASRLITVVEIAKRETAKAGGKWFQYSRVEGVVKEREREKDVEKMKGRKKEKGDDAGGAADGEVNRDGSGDGDAEEENEDDAFETMKTPFERAIEGTTKIRAIPVMTVYLSRIRINTLKILYGEQTNALT